jgi:hypothetical protein
MIIEYHFFGEKKTRTYSAIIFLNHLPVYQSYQAFIDPSLIQVWWRYEIRYLRSEVKTPVHAHKTLTYVLKEPMHS